jgi:hypothetical protein
MTLEETMCEQPDCGHIETTAFDHAAKAVVHHLLENTVILVTMSADGDEGIVHVDERSRINFIIATFAGPWAQKFFSDQPATMLECDESFCLIDELLGITSPLDSQVVIREELKEHARQMVLANETSIRTVAKHLVSHGDIGNPHHSFGWTATQILYNIIRTANPLPAE